VVRGKINQAPRFEISSSLGQNARTISQQTEDAARRAKESQEIARKDEEEAKEVALTAIYLKADYDKWCGLGAFFSDM
jgi:hypothetical protein